METQLTARQVVERLGGTAAAARIFNVKMSSISIWKRTTIPKARMMYIKLAFPRLFDETYSTTDKNGNTVLHTLETDSAVEHV